MIGVVGTVLELVGASGGPLVLLEQPLSLFVQLGLRSTLAPTVLKLVGASGGPLVLLEQPLSLFVQLGAH